jgi:hypothetical protein
MIASMGISARLSRAVRSAMAQVANQRRAGEFQGVHFADRVVLEQLEMTLLASLPSGDRLEGLDVPADERGQRYGLVLLACAYCCHGGIGADKLFMSPLRHLCNP